MNAETRFLIEEMFSHIEGAIVTPRGFFAGDKTIIIRTENMRNDACVEVCGRTVTIQPSGERVGSFRGYNWRVALFNAVRRAILDTEMAF